MKKMILVLTLLLSFMGATAFAANIGRVGFKAYSSSSPITCGVYGMRTALGGGFQGFSPYSSYSRTLTLGTKGYANYSTNGRGAIKFTCRITGTNTTTPVKVQWGGFLNGVEKHFLTLDMDTLVTQ